MEMAVPVRPRNWERADARCVRAVRASRGVVAVWVGVEGEKRDRWR